MRWVAARGAARAGVARWPPRAARRRPLPRPRHLLGLPRPARPALAANAPSLPTEAAWNQDISKAPRAPHSAAYIAYINSHGGDHLHPDFGSPRAYGFPYAVVGAGQRKLPIHYTAYGDESDPGPFPIPKGAPVEGGNGSDGDRHVLVVDRASCTLYELYRAFFDGEPRRPLERRLGHRAGTCARPPAAPTAGPRPTPPACRSSPASSATTRSPPASSNTRSGSPSTAPATPGSTPPRTAPATPPTPTRRRWALRLRLKAGYGLGGFSGAAKAIAEAMKRYGLIVADNGSNWYFSGSSDRRWDDENLNQLKRIPGSAFEVVKSAAALHSC